MLTLDFNNFLMQAPSMGSDYLYSFRHVMTANQNNSTITFDEMWSMVIQIIDMVTPEHTVYVKHWKSDIFMSIYAALTYTIMEPLTKQSIVKFITELQELPDTADSIRSSLTRSCRELRELCKHSFLDLNNPYSNCSYFINACEEEKPIKAFHPYDMYCYLKSYKKLPLWLENFNGTTLSKWYKNTSELFKEIHQFDSNITDVDFQFRDYVFEQIFAPCRFTAILSGFTNIFTSHFESIDSPSRERAIIYSTVFAKLPSDTLKNISQAFSPTLEQLLQLDTLEHESTEKADELRQSLFHFLQLPHFFLPLCQTLLANIMYYTYLARYDNQTVLKELKNNLQEYLNHNINHYCYNEKVRDALKSFETMLYPIKGSPPLTKELRNNAAVKSFGYNFTYNFYLNDSDNSPFDSKQIQNPRSFVFNKTLTTLQRIYMTDNIYTINFLQAMNRHALIIPLQHEKDS